MSGYDGYQGIAQFYDLFDTKKNQPFYAIVCEENNRLLDIGAGTGRIAIPLALDEKKVWAVEPSGDMLRILEEKIKMHDLDEFIYPIQASATSFDLDQSFDCAIMSGTFDHLLTIKERVNALQKIHKHLEKNARFVFDVHLGLMDDMERTKVNDFIIDDLRFQRFIVREIKGKQITTTLDYKVVNTVGDIIEEHTVKSSTATSSLSEIKRLLKQNKFTIEDMYSDYQFTQFQAEDQLLVILAKKSDG